MAALARTCPTAIVTHHRLFVVTGKDEIEEAVRRERDDWKKQIAAANQEIEDVRSELQQTLQRWPAYLLCTSCHT